MCSRSVKRWLRLLGIFSIFGISDQTNPGASEHDFGDDERREVRVVLKDMSCHLRQDHSSAKPAQSDPSSLAERVEVASSSSSTKV